MAPITRRAALAAAAFTSLAKPALLAAQTSSAPVRIGLLSDVGGSYRDMGGPGSRVAAEMACEDFGSALLDRPLQVLQADNQNKADVASTLTREWLDERGVTVVADGAGSSAGLAIQEIARQRRRIFLMATPLSTAFIGRQCSPYGFQFVGNTYAAAKGIGSALVRAGGDSWFFITADYEFGTSMQRDTTEFVRQAGGRVVGSVRAPLGTMDFSSSLLQAQASRAKVIGLANGGADLQNCIKQAAEFGLARRGIRLATPFMILPDVIALGRDTCEGLVLTNSFYWAVSPTTRAWSERFRARAGKLPNEYNAGMYAAVTHWLKSARAAGTLDADAVADAMRAAPLSDFYNEGVRIMPNGAVPHAMYLWEVAKREEGGDPWDAFRQLSVLPSPEAFPPPDLFGCPLVSR